MIKVYLYRNGSALLNPAEISNIKAAGASSGWHGIRSFIKMTTGETLECLDSVEEIERKLNV